MLLTEKFCIVLYGEGKSTLQDPSVEELRLNPTMIDSLLDVRGVETHHTT